MITIANNQIIGDQIFPDLVTNVEAYRCFKKPIAVKYRFANASQTIETKEGPVDCQMGDAIVTGPGGESWPIPRKRFDVTYDKIDGYTAVKRHTIVNAIQPCEPFQVKVMWSEALLQGKGGDWLVQYGPNDYGIVDIDIFENTYQIVL